MIRKRSPRLSLRPAPPAAGMSCCMDGLLASAKTYPSSIVPNHVRAVTLPDPDPIRRGGAQTLTELDAVGLVGRERRRTGEGVPDLAHHLLGEAALLVSLCVRPGSPD